MLGQATWKDSVDLTKRRVCVSPASWSDPRRAVLRQGSFGSCESMLWAVVVELYGFWYKQVLTRGISYSVHCFRFPIVAISFSIYDRVSCTPGWCGTCYVAVDNSEAPVSGVLRVELRVSYTLGKHSVN